MLRALGAWQQPLLAVAENLLGKHKPPGPIILPKGFKPLPATPAEEIDRVVDLLYSKREQWVNADAKSRAVLLRDCIDTTLAVCEEGAKETTEHKGSYGNGIGDELLSWVPVVGCIREYAETLESLATKGSPPPAHKLTQRKDESHQWVADVWPTGLDALLYGGFRGEVWLHPGKEPTQARLYKEKAAGGGAEKETGSGGGVCLVLGAGNYLPVIFWDILHVLITQDQVVVCKMNPANEYLGPYIRRALQPFVDAGYLEFVYGGGEVGKQISDDERVVAVHLTGSVNTYDAIVWQGQKPQSGVSPPFKKPVHAELGCVTPYIIVPGPWSDSDIEYHADSVATGVANNAGHNCVHAEVLITDAAWPLREKFLAAVKKRLDKVPRRVAYYPGSGKKYDSFKSRFPNAEELGVKNAEEASHHVELNDSRRMEVKTMPWLVMTGLSPEEASVEEENFCGVLQEVCFSDTQNDPSAFMKSAVKFANERCWGTLSCTMIVHPKTQSKYKKEVDEAVAALEFGSVCVNVPSMIGVSLTKLGWGAWGGELSPEPRYGNCMIHNTLMFDHVQKSVLWAPWRFYPFPFWSISHTNTESAARCALKFNACPSLSAMSPLGKESLIGIPNL